MDSIISYELLQVLNEYAFPNIATLDFSYFGPECQTCTNLRNGQVFHSKSGNKVCDVILCETNNDDGVLINFISFSLLLQVQIKFTRRDPAEKLVGEDAGKLLVAMFAWDGNAYVGNEYWMSALAASGI